MSSNRIVTSGYILATLKTQIKRAVKENAERGKRREEGDRGEVPGSL